MNRLTNKKDSDFLKGIEESLNTYGTPFFMFDTDKLHEHVVDLKERFGDSAKLCYAMKANSFLIKSLDKDVPYFEVCSPGELKICRRNGISPDKIVLSGVYKEINDMEYAMIEYGVTTYTIESYEQFSILNTIAAANNKNINIIIRITSGNQFGVDETMAENIINFAKKNQNINIQGIQKYSGTQKKKAEVVVKEFTEFVENADRLEKDCGIKLEKIEYGPGLFVPYFQNDNDIREELLNSLIEVIKKLNSMKKREIVLEMGRFIAAECGYYVSSIVDIKRNSEQNYCIIDGGINHLNYYGQTMAMKLMHYDQLRFVNNKDNLEIECEKKLKNDLDKSLKRSLKILLSDGNIKDNEKFSEKDIDKYTTCGSLCTTADVIVKNMPLVKAELGDVIIFKNTGAYSVTEGIYLFLSRDMPVVLEWSEKSGIKLLRERFETNEING